MVPRIPVVELSGEKLKAGSDSWNSACQEVYPNFAHGYSGKSSILPIYESVRIVNPTYKQECQNFTDFMWPHGNQHFCETVYLHAILLAEMQELVVKMLFESYGLDKEYCESHLKSTNYLMTLQKYEKSDQTDTNMGLMGHTDKSFLSILHQNHVKGLEIKLNDGENDHWIFYEPSSPSSFIVLCS
ncbi:2-oxoglutarate (2OG) and Fe(II)-dependent oxygenase superfamily protein [Euphorbia peplus]|nr:2-oxoglutarate (2OG) and Fe(II)-dependent oxygenase superfamily protein [Euphorbia peplus]